MNSLKLIRKFLLQDMETKFLLLEALVYLGWARCLIALPFNKVALLLRVQSKETPVKPIEELVGKIKNISRVIEIMSNHTFWENKCLVRAIAAMKMLERRKIESTLYLGTAKDENGRLIAHAWLRSGTIYITGAEVMNQFTVVGKFAKRIKHEW